MAYQETTRQSYGSKVKNSFQGILWGIILIIAGTAILWWNEGRAVKASDALKDFQKNYIELPDIHTVDPAYEGKAVHATGVATTADTLRDNAFGIAVNAMKLVRNVEYYQWTERSSSQSKDKLGGSTETTTTYTYEAGWCSSPVNSNDFKDPDYKGKNFVLRTVENAGQTASNVTFGAYRLTPGIVGRVTGEEPAYPSLSEAQKKQLLANIADSTVVVTVSGDQVYIGANPAEPRIGDVRIRFTQVTSPKTISLLQKVVNGTFENYVAKNGKQFSKVEMGTVSAENMIENQKAANKTWLWILRIIGVILVISGFRGLVNFLSTVFAVVPFVQRIIGAGVSLVASLAGLIWSIIVIALAWVAHRPVLAITLLVTAAALIFLLVRRSKKKKSGDMAALLLLILLMTGTAGCTGSDKTDQNHGGEEIPSAAIGLKGPVKCVSVTYVYGEGEPFTTVFQYDENGKIVSRTEETWDDDYGVLENLSEKDAQGRYTKEAWGTNGEVLSYTLYEYDSGGRVVKVQYVQPDGTVNNTVRSSYDDKGRLTVSTSETAYGSNRSEYDYDDKGHNVRYAMYHNGSLSNVTTYEYDAEGRQTCSIEELPGLGKKYTYLVSYNADGEVISSTNLVTDEKGTRVSSRDSSFTDRNGLLHQRTYSNYDDEERTYESTFNKQHAVTHYEFFDGNARQPSIVADFKYAADGTTLKEIVWQEFMLGQLKDTKKKVFDSKNDTFGNWTLATSGPSYNFDAKYMTWDNFISDLSTTVRKIEYRGEDQGNNYGFEGKAGTAPVRLVCTNDDDVMFGELTIDGNVFRAVGRREADGRLFFVALTENGDIPWSLSISSATGKVDAALFSGADEIKASLKPTRKDLKTFRFSTTPDDLVGIYQYEYRGGNGSGKIDVSRSGEDWENIKFEICNVGKAPSYNMAKDEFEEYFGDRTLFYRFLWNDSSDEGFEYSIRFFDGFAVILAGKGEPGAFFGHGTTIQGIYAKLPSVG